MHQVSVQKSIEHLKTPPLEQLEQWAKHVLALKTKTAELVIRLVDIDEMTDLNQRYRQKSGATNVLSFPFETLIEIPDELPFLGDIIICAPIIYQEATNQDKQPEAHWAHMVIHGTLHLLGYDHETTQDAAIMEPEEIILLQQLGFSNPYQQ